MVEISLTAIRAFAIEAMNLQQSGAQEDVLRHLLSNRLPLMFPENPWWIREHSIGAEANVHFVDAEGLLRNGFVDSLVGLTAIEYERNLSSDSVYAMGYSQLKEYCAALLNRGIEYGDIIGILSDTVRWHAFRVQVTQAPPSVREYGPNNIELHEIDYVSLEHHNDDSFIRFGRFINHYLGRVGSRELDAMTLARDMGFDSVFCEQNIVSFLRIVDDAFSERPEYGNMIASLWQSFVSHLENDGGQPFNRTVYANELYIITLGKLLCANILNGSVVRDEATNLECILNGEWFRARGFVNLVEYDYFGWLNEPPYIDRILVVARRMQHDLGAYNYHVIEREDLFGPLVAQLANRDRRLLLGQEYTPQWLAQRMVARSMELLPEEDFPNFVDMCCGSGVFVVETINQTISRYGINPGNCSPAQLGQLMSCIVGFDIDPLAVLLAKLNWAMAMREFVPHAVSDLVIPIYHADSLFTVAPITTSIDGDYEEQDLQMNFDGEHVGLPGFLMNPSNRRLFDTLVHVCYETAKARVRNGTEEACSRAQVGELVETVVGDVGIHLGEEQRVAVVTSCQALIATLERLQRDNRNGIWPFLLGNGYRPALVRNQFNAIVSNPPWMAMSKLHDNPYRSVLVSRAERYGIKPDGSSHLHTELATVFFLNSVDKFLQQDGIASILMPDTLLNGYHHEPFRNQRYADADWPVNLTLSEIWEVHVDTFKNKSIAVFARKMDGVNSNPLPGRRVHENLPDEPCQFRLLRRSRRSAWSSNPAAQDITDVILDEIPFRQGADIMPRTIIFHNVIRQPNGRWAIRPIPRHGHSLSYLVGQPKTHKDFSIRADNVDDQFVYDCYLSHHILPFHACNPAKALLPIRKEDGRWMEVGEVNLVRCGTGTSAAFSRIFEELGKSSRQYFEKLNTRNKLSIQLFDHVGDEKYLVMAGAGGGYTCAAYIPFTQIDRTRTIIDQTNYWYIADSEIEALYITGLLNSSALDSIIADFQPEGAQGRRHVHKLPYAVTPRFDAENPMHISVAITTQAIIGEVMDRQFVFDLVAPTARNLGPRRRRVREFIGQLPGYSDYEEACRGVYNV